MSGRIGELTAADGTPLCYRRWGDEAAGATVLIVPGLGDHAGRYAALAAELAAEGVNVLAVDLRGQGLSGGQRGHVRRWADLLSDLDRLIQELVHPDSRLVLFGQSLGGLVALRYHQLHPERRLAGLVLSAPAMGPPDPPPPRWKHHLALVLSTVFPRASFHNQIDPTDVCRDPEGVDAYRGDPLVHGRITARTYAETLDAMRAALADAPRVTVPAMLIMVAGQDRIVDPRATLLAARALEPYTQVELRHYPEFYHEPFNEPEREVALGDLERWLLPLTR